MNSLTRRLIAGAIVLGLSLYARPVFADQVTLLSIQSGHSVVLRAEGLTRVAVGDGRIAGVVPVGTSQVVINGKSGGHTTVYIWAGGRREVYEVTVTEQQLDDLAQMLRSAIPEPNVQVVSFDHIDRRAGNRLRRRAVPTDRRYNSRFAAPCSVNGEDDKAVVIVNAVTISQNLGDMQRAIASIPGASGVRVDPDGRGNVIVSGNATDAVTAQAILDRARGLAGPYLASNGQLIDRLNSLSDSLIDIKVYVLEVDKTATSNLGIQLYGAQPVEGQPTPNLIPPSIPFFESIRPPGLAGDDRSVLPHDHPGSDAQSPHAGGARKDSLEPGFGNEPGGQGDLSGRRLDPGRDVDRPGGHQRPVPALWRAAQRDPDRSRQRLGRGGHRARDLGPRLYECGDRLRLHDPGANHKPAYDRCHHATGRKHPHGRPGAAGSKSERSPRFRSWPRSRSSASSSPRLHIRISRATSSS